MARYVTPELRERIEAAESGETVELALVPAADGSGSLDQRAEEYGVTIERTLPSGVVLAVGPADVVEDFLDTSAIGSASAPDRAQTLGR